MCLPLHSFSIAVAHAASLIDDDCRVLIFCNDGRRLETLAEVLARDWNGILWREGCYAPTAATATTRRLVVDGAGAALDMATIMDRCVPLRSVHGSPNGAHDSFIC